MASRGMNMRDMKARAMNKASKTAEPPKPNTGRRGLDRGRNAMGTGYERQKPEGEGDEPELLDELEEAVHEARGDGHFAPTARKFSRDDSEEHECPDEPPPGWEGE